MMPPTEGSGPPNRQSDTGYRRLAAFNKSLDADSIFPRRNTGASGLHSPPRAPPRTLTYEILREAPPSSMVDVATIRQWMLHCDGEHGSHCHPQWVDVQTRGAPRLLIDVIAGCLVSSRSIPSTRPSYAALSYVWGEAQPFRTTLQNVRSLQEPEALYEPSTNAKIPRTIRSAMRLSKLLGLQYLWVDSLCIVQDDEAQKYTELDQMGDIYQGAILTIAATQGEDADAGIHFLDEPPAPDEDDDGQTQAKAYSETDSTWSEDKAWTYYRWLAGSSCWGSRAWTLQELLFSKRLIFFTQQGALWECHCANRWSAHPLDTKLLHAEFPPSSLATPRAFHDQTWPDLELYTRTVLDYNERLSTNETDVTRAFAGVTGSLSGSFGSFVFGLPALFFDWTLLWQPKAILRERKAGPEETGVKMPPSWSWMSLRGPLDLDLWTSAYDYLYRDGGGETEPSVKVTPLVEWHLYNSQEDQIPIGPAYRVYHQHDQDQETKTPPGWRYIEERRTFQHASDPVTEFAFPIPVGDSTLAVNASTSTTLISCHARRGYFKLGKYDNNKRYGAATVAIVNEKKKDIGFIRVNMGTLRAQRLNGTVCELIAISSGEEDVGEDGPLPRLFVYPYDFYNVLWIEWVDGIAYRQGLGRVEKSDWEDAETEEIHVVLG